MHKQTGASAATSLDAIAEALRKAVANNGETPTSIAAKTPYSRQSLKRWLGKRRDQLDLHKVTDIALAIGVDPAAILSAEAHS